MCTRGTGRAPKPRPSPCWPRRGAEGLDTSPRGDAPGCGEVVAAHTLLLPDRRGNQRIDNLRNIVHNPALVLLIPDVAEALRDNGTARASTLPRAMGCHGGAQQRSGLCNPAQQLPAGTLPSPGTALECLGGNRIGRIDGPTCDAGPQAHQAATLY